MSTRFDVIHDSFPYTTHVVESVERLDRGDPQERRLSHCYFDDGDGWAFGDSGGGYYARFGSNYREELTTQPDDWSYIVHFIDGTRGTCRVRAINRALEQLGARINFDSTP